MIRSALQAGSRGFESHRLHRKAPSAVRVIRINTTTRREPPAVMVIRINTTTRREPRAVMVIRINTTARREPRALLASHLFERAVGDRCVD